jgi:hypothetical protein
MAKKPEPFTWTGWGRNHASQHATNASNYLQKLGRAADVHDRLKAHAEFIHTHLAMCNERANLLSQATAAAGDIMGALVSVLHRRKLLDDMATRNSPASRPNNRQQRTRNPSVKRGKRRRG